MNIKAVILNKHLQIHDYVYSLSSTYANVATPIRNEWIKSQAKNIPKGSRVLDVGAGMCPYRSFFDHCVYITHDFVQYKGTDKGPSKDEWQYGKIDIVSDIEKIPVKDKSFDVIVCTEVFEHIPEPIQAIREFSRIMKPGGKVLISAPLASGLHQEPFHFYGGFTPHFYKKYLTMYGFHNIKITPEGGFFKHLSQEIYRGSNILLQKKHNQLLGFFMKNVLAKKIWNIEKDIFIAEFTIGFLVEATKKRA